MSLEKIVGRHATKVTTEVFAKILLILNVIHLRIYNYIANTISFIFDLTGHDSSNKNNARAKSTRH